MITFYAGQVLCINRALRASGLGGEGLRVMTVDSFQGSECDVVLLSFVRSNARGSVGFVKDFQRLNVALTRAKHLLVCVGCAQTLLSDGKNLKGNGDHSHLSNIITDAKQRDRLFFECDLIL